MFTVFVCRPTIIHISGRGRVPPISAVLSQRHHLDTAAGRQTTSSAAIVPGVTGPQPGLARLRYVVPQLGAPRAGATGHAADKAADAAYAAHPAHDTSAAGAPSTPPAQQQPELLSELVSSGAVEEEVDGVV